MEPVLTIVVGVTILTVIGVMSGGTFLLKITTAGSEFTPLQKTFFRAGHAHAGVLVILGLVCVLLQDAAGVGGVWVWAAVGVLVSALLIPGGFFLSVLGHDVEKPGRAIALLWVGAAVLAVALLTVGISLIAAGMANL
ncbi:hypothetical protein [Cryobacterium sp. N22]|uniref:hypothetical protein n=1 Tax=Cryobacterium sp. N22 TaxID=2048290 RepID=UPI000CE46FF6|nr:hypothetical protein [Cryobacterium sp. N22]